MRVPDGATPCPCCPAPPAGLCPLLEASNQGIDLWLAQRKQAAQEADAVADPMPL